jgi:dihydrofolate synthase/folylpolyglutamate synthase
MNYEESLDWLFGMSRYGAERGLEPMFHLMTLLGDPHDSFISIHVTGTNGKGSTSAMASSILTEFGFRVGLFTSPHLERFTERIKVDGEEIMEDEVARLATLIRPMVEEMAEKSPPLFLRFFDVVTAIAFKYYQEKGIDYAVLEVGMGGTLDATNVVDAPVSVITNVGLEHTNILGETVLAIAEKKAGIIKPGGTLITATADNQVYQYLSGVCNRLGSKIYRVGEDIIYRKLFSDLDQECFTLQGLSHNFEELCIPLLGRHQITNASTAVASVEALKLDLENLPESIKCGLMKVEWPGRLEIVGKSPLVILDCAKDPYAAKALREALTEEFKFDRLTFVISISDDKNIHAMIQELTKVGDRFIATRHKVMGRAVDPHVISAEVTRHGKPCDIIPDPYEAIYQALEASNDRDLVCITGSVFLVGDARSILKPKKRN